MSPDVVSDGTTRPPTPEEEFKVEVKAEITDSMDTKSDLCPSWKASMKFAMQDPTSPTMKLQADIDRDKVTEFGAAQVLVYEFRMLLFAIPLIIWTTGLTVLCMVPFYEYGKDAIDTLIDVGFVQSPDMRKGMGPDDRFIMEYSWQDQAAQEYEGLLLRSPSWLVAISGILSPMLPMLGVSLMFACAWPIAEGKKQIEYWDGVRKLAPYALPASVLVCVAQTLKALGYVSSVVGSAISFPPCIGGMCLFMRLVVRAGGESRVCKGTLYTVIVAMMLTVVVNQSLMKRVTSDVHCLVLWMFWVVAGEYTMAYARKGLRNLDVSVTDSKFAPFTVVATFNIINLAKRVPQLLMTTIPMIVLTNVLCCLVEVLNRTTLAARDRWMDAKLFKADQDDISAWANVTHRQVYLHCEMLQELLELVGPIPMTVMMYMVNFTVSEEPPQLSVMILNCSLQMLQEVVADCIAIWWCVKYQGKFYRVGLKNLNSREQNFVFLISSGFSAFGVLGMFLLQYLRVGLTKNGDYVTLI
jgi:hypothetical protein